MCFLNEKWVSKKKLKNELVYELISKILLNEKKKGMEIKVQKSVHNKLLFVEKTTYKCFCMQEQLLGGFIGTLSIDS